MKVLIFGGNGQLGADCAEVFAPLHEVRALGRDACDITDSEAVQAAISGFSPRVIVNCAAFTQVDLCETQRQACMAANAEGPKNLARVATSHGARLIHVSTDYVFDGQKPLPHAYTEDDPTGPLSFYGQSKLAGEQAVAKAGPQHLIVRTAWLYGARGRNFLKAILEKALSGSQEPLRVVNDQAGSATWSLPLARQIAALADAGPGGVYHAASHGYGTWFDVAKRFLELMGISRELIACSTSEFPRPAVRPKNSILENARLKRLDMDIMPYWERSLEEFVEAHGPALLYEAKRK